MRLAFVATSSYARSGQLGELVHAQSQGELLRHRLSEVDAGFQVESLRAERGLAESLESRLASLSAPPESVLFFFSGYVAVSEEDVPSLILDGERLSTLSLKRVRRLLSEHCPASFVVLDTVTAFDGVHSPDAVVRMLNETVAGRKIGIHLLAANRKNGHAPHEPSPFASLLALALDWQAGDEGLTPEGLFAAMRREATLFSQIDRALLFKAAAEFQLLIPSTARVYSLPPKAAALELEGAEARADTFVEAGKLDVALDEYTLALEHLGPPPTPAHAPLYLKIASVLRKVNREDDALLYYEAALDIVPESGAALEGAAELSLASEDRGRALELLERWLRADPNAVAAAERAAKIFAEAGEWDRLAALYESVLERVSDPKAATELALKVNELYSDLVGDESRARRALERAVELDPDDPRVRLRLSNICEKRGHTKLALEHLFAALRSDPGHVAGYRTAMRLFDRSKEPDGVWNAACALEVLGEADVNESLLAGAHRPDGLMSAKDSLSEAEWEKRLLCPERETSIDRMFAALGDALVQVGLETAQRKRRLIAVDPSTAQDPTTSTTMLLKTLAWSTRLLGIPIPKVHIGTDLQTPFAVPPLPDPTLFVSKSLGTGLDMPELAFLWSRQLVFLRPEHRPLVFFPNVPELAALLIATLSLGGVAQLPFKKLEGDAKFFARGLKRHLSPEALAKIESDASIFPLKDASERVLKWVRAIELACARAGLLACGSSETAAKMTRKFPMRGAGQADAEVKELLAFSVSAEYAALRERLGVRVRS